VECGREGFGYLGGREDGEVRVGLPRHECPPPEQTNLAAAGTRLERVRERERESGDGRRRGQEGGYKAAGPL
jgi:hypothetical protein